MLNDVGCNGSKFMVNTELLDRLNEFIENEGKTCSFNPELITPLYVFRMWEGTVAIEDIDAAFERLKRNDDLLFMGK